MRIQNTIKYIILQLSVYSMPRKKVNDYIIDMDSCLGEGAFGQVYRGVDDRTKKDIAIKILSKKKIGCDETMKEAYITEIKIMRKLKADNIVEFIDVVETTNHYYVIQEYCNGGDLRKRIDQCKKFTEKQVVSYLKDILSGFITLISNGVIHRDVKPENILINNNKMKIADFGFAKVVLSSSQLNKTLVGTPLYMSPQLLKSQKYTSKCDIWAIGILTYELLYGKYPWIGNNQVDLFNNMMKLPLKFNDQIKVSQEFKDFITGCLKVEEKERSSWKQVFTHKLFGDVFKQFIQKHDQQQRKFKEVMNNLRILVHTNDVDLQKIFQQLELTNNSLLTKQVLGAIMKKIAHGDKIMQEFQLIIKKLDEDADNVVSFQSFKQLLKTCNIETKSLRKRKNDKVQLKATQNEIDIESVKVIIKKLRDRMKETNIMIDQLYVSYAKTATSPLNFQKFEKLFLKIDKSLSRQQVKFCFSVFDANKDGQVTLKDFEDTIRQYS